MLRLLCSTFLTTSLLSASALAQAPVDEPVQGRAEVNWRMGHERSIFMTEFWVPFAQSEDLDNILYGSLRMMGDDQDNREGNIGIGYRNVVYDLPVMGDGVAGVHGWLDRRITDRGSTFHQVTLGTEWLGADYDILLNGYLPLSNGKSYTVPNPDPQGPALAGTGIVIDTDGTLLEEPQHGFDLELGLELGQYFDAARDYTDSFRVYAGGYYFDSDNTERVTGWRTRFTADVTQNIQIGARFQSDDERGSQGFLEATFRFPFGHKKSYRKHGLRARLDDSPERDIDIVTGQTFTDPGDRVPVVNQATGQPQEVLHVDNSAAGGGDGSAESPFNTLANAQAAASAHTIIYVNRGTGDDTNQDQGITLDKQGQQLIGSGTAFVYDGNKFTTANGANPSLLVIAEAGTAPVIGNVNAGQDGVTITADNVKIAGLTVDNANTGRDGVVVRADGAAASAQNVTIENVTARNARMGVYLHGTDGGAVSAKVQNTITTSNSQHGMAVYDDTDDTFTVDLGGGSMGSVGNNVLAGNTLEDLAVDYDGRALAAQNNWWGQASGPDTDTPDIGIAPQIYYGAPINDGLVGHWTFDSEWTTNTTAYDRSGEGNDGSYVGGLSLADTLTGQNREALNFDGGDDHISVATSPELTPLSAITVSAWINPDILAGSVAIAKAPNSNGWDHGWRLRIEPTASYPRVFTSAGVTSTHGFGISTGAWQHVVFTYDSTEINSYIDNNRDSTPAVQTGNIAYPIVSDLRIGVSAGVTRFDGGIDNIQIYDRALDPPEISELYRMDTSSSVSTSGFLTAAP